MYTIRDVATLYGITPENARQWAIEFATYLSPTATPSDRQKRVFTDEDMAVFDLIAKGKKAKRTFEDLHIALQAGQRGVAPQLPATDIQALAMVEGERRLVAQVDRLTGLLAARTEQVDQLKADLAALNDAVMESTRLKAQVDYLEADRQQLRTDLAAMTARIEALAERAGREYAKGYVDALKAPKQD